LRVLEEITCAGDVVSKKTEVILVVMTCKSRTEARQIVTSLVEKRLAACGNIVEPTVTSIYRWKGRIERAEEVLVILKSTRKAFLALEREVTHLHSYEVPEIIALPIVAGSRKYLSWVDKSVGKK
jgi:periplasmic divalent cation tolerance protein